MNEIEDLVSAFLERREGDPDLSPEHFARDHEAAGPGLLPALQAALGAAELLAQAALPRPGSIGPYRVLRELGRGGMGVVYEAERDGERCAVKVLLHAEMRSARSLERFRREAAALRRVEHAGVVRVRDEGTVDGAPWLAMDLVDGRPLTDQVGRTDPATAARLVRDLALAVEAVHASGVLHRDLKPSNVLLTADGRPVLCDFGLVHTEDEGTLTSTGELLGTPRYMAPEQVLGRECDARTDVHALGLLLYELACGRPAHDGGSRAEILSAVARGVSRRPRRIEPAVPRPLERIVLQAVALDPARRYATAGALAEDLSRFLGGDTVLARPPGPISRAWMRARAAPRRTTLAAAALLSIAALAVRVATRDAAGTGPELARAMDRAAWAWIEGQDRIARRNVLVARGLAPEDGAVNDLADRIEHPESVAERAPDGATIAGALHAARAARIDSRFEDALRILEPALDGHPSSAALRAEQGWALHELGRAEDAGRAFARAIELDPGSVLAHEAHAAWSFERGRARDAVESAHQAARLAVLEGEPPTRLPKLLERAADHAELRAILRERLSAHPEDDDTRFALAVSLDGDHQLGEAADEYAALVGRAPDHAWALTYLAYLQLGALGERCPRCVEAYRAAPAVPDAGQGARNLVRAVEADAGRDEDLLRTIVTITLDKGLREPVAAALRRLLETRERSARTARLESALRRLE